LIDKKKKKKKKKKKNNNNNNNNKMSSDKVLDIDPKSTPEAIELVSVRSPGDSWRSRTIIIFFTAFNSTAPVTQ